MSNVFFVAGHFSRVERVEHVGSASRDHEKGRSRTISTQRNKETPRSQRKTKGIVHKSSLFTNPQCRPWRGSAPHRAWGQYLQPLFRVGRRPFRVPAKRGVRVRQAMGLEESRRDGAAKGGVASRPPPLPTRTGAAGPSRRRFSWSRAALRYGEVSASLRLCVKIPAGGGPGPRQYAASPTSSQFAILGPRYCTRTRWSVVPFARAGTFLSFA